jgi:hypothetical protein
VDFNRKIPYRGLMPRIKTEVVPSAKFAGAYGINTHNMIINSSVYIEPLAKTFYYLRNVFVNPMEIYSRYMAQSTVNTIIHEFTHATQAYPYIRREGQHDYEKAFSLARAQGPTYFSSLDEIGSHALNHMTLASVFCPKNKYTSPMHALGFSFWFKDLLIEEKDTMLHLANMRERLYVGAYTDEQIEDEIQDWYRRTYKGDSKSRMDKSESGDMHRKLDRKKYFIVDFFKKTRPGRYGQGFQQFIEDFEPYYQTYLRAISRNFHLFKPINDRFALLNANSYR